MATPPFGLWHLSIQCPSTIQYQATSAHATAVGQARSAISNQQKHQVEKAALQDSLTTQREEARQLQEDKAAALQQLGELQKQLGEGQVCTPPCSAGLVFMHAGAAHSACTSLPCISLSHPCARFAC